jgi:hypothetical protein
MGIRVAPRKLIDNHEIWKTCKNSEGSTCDLSKESKYQEWWPVPGKGINAQAIIKWDDVENQV